jgi:hypothetical protein
MMSVHIYQNHDQPVEQHQSNLLDFLSNRLHMFEPKHFSSFVNKNDEFVQEDVIFQSVNASPNKF